MTDDDLLALAEGQTAITLTPEGIAMVQKMAADLLQARKCILFTIEAVPLLTQVSALCEDYPAMEMHLGKETIARIKQVSEGWG